MPYSIGGDFGGFVKLVEIHRQVSNIPSGTITLDCSRTGFFGANLCAVLAGIVSLAQSRGLEFTFENVTGKLQDIWDRNHFLSIDPHRLARDPLLTVVHFKRFAVNDDEGFQRYIHTELLGKQDMPHMSRQAKKKILESIYEIFSNAVIHSDCTEIFTCGQYYPNRHMLEFTIVDMGRTVKANVNAFLRAEKTGREAIRWAVEEGKTTKQGSIPGGLGLAIIRNFLTLNRGKLQIVSSDGFWEVDNGHQVDRNMGTEFPGTIVNLTVNMKDLNSYRLATEPIDVPIF